VFICYRDLTFAVLYIADRCILLQSIRPTICYIEVLQLLDNLDCDRLYLKVDIGYRNISRYSSSKILSVWMNADYCVRMHLLPHAVLLLDCVSMWCKYQVIILKLQLYHICQLSNTSHNLVKFTDFIHYYYS
jgi:hypothetical protein